jgi:predicted O-linked N-acetylglucosamine transferase (SPINDLY family)
LAGWRDGYFNIIIAIKAEQIYQDEIDILIDLDSMTLDLSCEVMALKPAPIQVTWLGWDASGIPRC